MQNSDAMQNTQSLLALALLGILCIIFLPTTGTSDVCDWLDWGRNVYENGLAKGYAMNRHEHPPFFSVLLYAAMALADATGMAPFYGLKITFLVALLASMCIIHCWSQRNTAITILFFIPLAYSCLSLSYMDIYFTPFFLLSLYFVHRQKPVIAIAFFIAAALIKSPPLIIAPFLLVYLYCHFRKIHHTWQTTLSKTLQALLPSVVIATLVTYSIFGNEPVAALLRGFGHNCLSCNALNFNRLSPVLAYNFSTGQNLWDTLLYKTVWVESYKQSDTLLYGIAKLLFAGFYLSSLLVFMRRKKDTETLLIFCLLGHFAYFTFSKGVHENHLYLSMLIAICLSLINPRYLVLALNISLIHSLNLFLSYGMNGMPLALWWDKSFYPNDVPSLSWLNTGYPIDSPLLMSMFDTLYFLVFWLFAICIHPTRSSPSIQASPSS